MKLAPYLLRRRNAFTLIELLVVMALILVIAALGLGYIVFGQDNQHSVSGAQALTGALLNAKQRAKRDGVPTGVRIIFGPTTQAPTLTAAQASQLELVQQPEDYVAGTCSTVPNNLSSILFSNVDFQGGASGLNVKDQSPVEVGDYFLLAGTQTVHQIIPSISGPAISGPATAPTITLASPVAAAISGASYSIIRAPRRLPSEDIIQLPSGIVIDQALSQGIPPSATSGFYEIVFAPSGAVTGQGTGADKVYLGLRDPTQATLTGGAPLILSVQIRTGFIGVYPVAPGTDPYAYVKDPRSSGL